MARKGKWRDFSHKNWDFLQFDDILERSPQIKLNSQSHVELEALWSLRVRSHPTVDVFGLPVCSQCRSRMIEHENNAPGRFYKPDRTIKVWTCPNYCQHNKKIRLRPCDNCGVREGRYMIDSRYCRTLTNPRRYGHWCACRQCGSFGDPQEITAVVLNPDPILTAVFSK